MPILNGFQATEKIRALELRSDPQPESSERLSRRLNGRIPIFAVSASLHEKQRDEMFRLGIDGWILKPIDFKRLQLILKGITSYNQRRRDVYHPGINWEAGGWLHLHSPQSSPD
jgi:CheY-like chemotaxis protein